MLNIVSTKLLAFIPTLQLVLVMAGNFFSKGIKLLLLAVSIAFGCIYALPSQANEKHRVIEIIERHLMENDNQNLLDFTTNAILEHIALEEISVSKPANEKNLKAWLDVSRFLHGLKEKSSKSNDQYMTQLIDEWLCIIHSNLASKYNYGIKNALHICQSYFNQYVRKNGLEAVISMPVIEFVIDIFSLNNRYGEISEIVQLAEVDSDYLASMPPEDYSTLTTNLGRMSIYLDARKKGFAILKNYVKILEIDTDILKSFYSEINDEFNMYCQVLETKNDYRIDALLATKNYDLSSIILQHCINYMEKRIQEVYKRWGDKFSLGDNRGNGPAVFSSYSHFYKNLTITLLKQSQIEKAVEYLDRGRLLGLSFLMYRRNEYIKFAEMQRLAKENNSTFVIYSIFPNFGSDPNHKKDLGIFVIQPSGKLYFKLVPLNNIPSIVSSTSETLQKRSEQKIQSKPVFPSLTIFIGLGGFIVLTTCLVLFIRHKKIWYANGIAVILVIAGVSSFLYVQNQVLILNQPEPEEAPSPTVASSSNLTDITRLIDSSFSQNRSVKIQDTGTIAQDDQDCPNQETCLASLYQILIQPIEEYLPKEENSSIIFVPEGELHKVSFASLKDANGSYLIDKYVIGVTPSLRILKALPNRDKNTARDTNALIVGNPTMPPDPEAPDFDLAGTAANPQRYQNLPPLTSLPNAEIEAIEIAKLLGTPPLIGAEATRANVLSKMTSAKTIHLATHGLPYGFGVLALAPTNSEEGYLTGFHIADKFADKKLQADLVVLSACDTGTGHMSTEGSIGFARPFFIAGVPTVVASLWQVPDASTAELMVDFYKNMQTTDNKAQALRQAMLKTKEKYPDPYHWAGFVLFGKP